MPLPYHFSKYPESKNWLEKHFLFSGILLGSDVQAKTNVSPDLTVFPCCSDGLVFKHMCPLQHVGLPWLLFLCLEDLCYVMPYESLLFYITVRSWLGVWPGLLFVSMSGKLHTWASDVLFHVQTLLSSITFLKRNIFWKHSNFVWGSQKNTYIVYLQNNLNIISCYEKHSWYCSQVWNLGFSA